MKHSAVILTLLAVISLLPVPVSAQFVIHSVKGKVSLERNGVSNSASNGTDCDRGDVFNLSDGASISLLNKITNKIYSADGPATMTVSQIVTRAMNRSKSHGSNVAGQMKILADNSPATHVYEQNGMVRRSQAVLDPEAYSVNVEPEALAIAVINFLGKPAPAEAPLQVVANAEQGLSFRAKSTDDSPIYFNIIKFRSSDGKYTSADISELGQPVSAYILQPGQELTREQPEQTLPGELHLLVATPFGYDVDALLDSIEELLESGAQMPESEPELRVHIFPLNQI